MRFDRLILVLFCSAAFQLVARGDEVAMKDGRMLVGKVVAETPDFIRFDTVVDGTRASMTIRKDQYNSLARKSLPEGFFKDTETESQPPRASSGEYLEIPINGVFGKDVFASGIDAALRAASVNDVRHVVFTVNSSGNNDIDEARRVYRSVMRAKDKFQFHILIKDCRGDALSVLIPCKSIAMLPGAVVGGCELVSTQDDAKDAAERQLRRSLAEAVERVLTQQNRPYGAKLLAAMLDPELKLVVYSDDTALRVVDSAPADLNPDRILLQDNDDTKPLVISAVQAHMMKFPMVQGIDELGKVLGIEGWQSAGNDGVSAMKKSVDDQKIANARKESAANQKMKTNIERRDALQASIIENVKQAAQWDPNKGNYTSYNDFASRWNSDWGDWGGGGGGGSQTWTQASRNDWAYRSDATMRFLRRAGEAARTMKSLDKDAEALGLTPTYKPGELDQVIVNLDTAFRVVNAQRNRQGS